MKYRNESVFLNSADSAKIDCDNGGKFSFIHFFNEQYQNGNKTKVSGLTNWVQIYFLRVEHSPLNIYFA